MGARTDALWRILGLVYLATIGWIVLTVAAVAGLLWMITDVIGQLITGDEFMPAQTSRPTRFLKRLWDWGHDQMEYVLFGTGSFPILP